MSDIILDSTEPLVYRAGPQQVYGKSRQSFRTLDKAFVVQNLITGQIIIISNHNKRGERLLNTLGGDGQPVWKQLEFSYVCPDFVMSETFLQGDTTTNLDEDEQLEAIPSDAMDIVVTAAPGPRHGRSSAAATAAAAAAAAGTALAGMTHDPDSVIVLGEDMTDDCVNLIPMTLNFVACKLVADVVNLFEAGIQPGGAEPILPLYEWTPELRKAWTNQNNSSTFSVFCQLYIYIHLHKETIERTDKVKKDQWKALIRNLKQSAESIVVGDLILDKNETMYTFARKCMEQDPLIARFGV
jgi:hypothetical protein